jgi:hypothetical protein
MADKTINDFGVITTTGTDHLIAQTAGSVTGKMPVTQLEIWLDYYRKTAYVSLSTGAPDAGKPIVLDGSGQIHSSMLGGADLPTVLSAGNTTGGTDIVISSGDELTNEVDTDLNVSVATAGAGLAGKHLRISAGSGGTGVTVGGNILASPGAGVGGGADGTFRILGDGDVTGDLNVGGKLTVAGLIDPTGLVLEEASAPATGATEGAIFVDTADSKLKFRAKNNATVEDVVVGSGGGGATSTAMATVDPTSSDAVDDNDLTTAFVTIQGGVDALVAGTGGVVYVYPGVYDETIYILSNRPISIVGLPGPSQELSDRCVIRNTAAKPAVVISEATQVSLDALFALGSWSSYNANWGTLVYGGNIPSSVEIANMTIDPPGGQVAIFVGGTQANSTLLNTGLEVNSCFISGMFCRTAGKVHLDDVKSDYVTFWYNTGEIEIQNGWAFSHQIHYLAGSYEEPSGGMVGFNAAFWHVNGNIEWSGTQSAGPHSGNADGFFHNVYIRGGMSWVAAALGMEIYMTDSHIESSSGGAIQPASQVEVHFTNVWIETTFYVFAGGPACTFTGGGWKNPPGIDPDPGNRLTVTKEDDAWFYYNAAKATPVGADWFLVHDSADSDKLKRVDIGNLPSGGASVFEVDTTPTPDEIQPLLANKGASFVVGSQDTEDTGVSADDSRMFYHKGDRSFRAGRALGTEWDSANRGNESAAFGLNPTASGTQSFAAGANVEAQAAGSQSLGNYTRVTGSDATGGTAKGNYSNSYLRGQNAHSSDAFSSVVGSAQYSRVTLVAETVGATTEEMFLDALGTKSMGVPNNVSWAFEMLFVARQVASSGSGTVGNSAAYKAAGCVRNVGGTVTLVGAVTYTTFAEDDVSWPTPVVDVTATRLRTRATGVADQRIRWVAAVHLTEVFNG